MVWGGGVAWAGGFSVVVLFRGSLWFGFVEPSTVTCGTNSLAGLFPSAVQLCVQRAFHFRLSGIDLNILLQKSLQTININAFISRNHNTMQIQLV